MGCFPFYFVIDLPIKSHRQTRIIDQDVNKTMGKGPLTAEWRNDLLHGILTLKGTWADGTPLLAIPNYARLNRNVTTTPMPLPQGKTIGVATTNPTSQVWSKE